MSDLAPRPAAHLVHPDPVALSAPTPRNTRCSSASSPRSPTAPRPAAASPGRAIRGIVTVNGARVMLENGAWGLVRASSNTPNLVVVCESPESEAEMRAIFAELDA